MEENFESWVSLDEAATRTGISIRTLQRKIAAGEIRKSERPIPSRKPLTILHPADIERLSERVLTPVPVPRKEPRPNLAQALVTLASTMSSRHDATGGNGAVPIEKKIYLTLPEAVSYSGLPDKYIRRLITSKRLKVIDRNYHKTGGYKIKRSSLERL